MSAVVLAFPGCELPGPGLEAVELDHANREALAALKLLTLIEARNRHSLAAPRADKACKMGERLEAQREAAAREPVEEFDLGHLRTLRAVRDQIQWLIDRVERKQARAVKKREG